jgi:hypothetical protein
MSLEHRRVYLAFLVSRIQLKRDAGGVCVLYPFNLGLGYRLTSLYDGKAWSIVGRYCI